MIRRPIGRVAEIAVYGAVTGCGTTLLYAAFLAAKFGEQIMLVGLLAGVAVLVLMAAVMVAARRQPEESAGPQPAFVEDNLARPRLRAPRSHPSPVRHAPPRDPDRVARQAQIAMPLRRPRPQESTTVVLDLDATHVIVTDQHGGAR